MLVIQQNILQGPLSPYTPPLSTHAIGNWANFTKNFGQFLQTFQHDPKSFCFVVKWKMCYSSNCPTAKDKPIVSQKVFLDFQKYSPLKIAQRHKWHTFPFKFSPDIAGPPRPLCQQTQHPFWYCCIMLWLDIGYCVGLWPKLFSWMQKVMCALCISSDYHDHDHDLHI